MNIYVVGATGLLGLYSSRLFLDRGFQVRGAARNKPSDELAVPPALRLDIGNIAHQSEAEIVEKFRGCDAVVYAIGADERALHPAPVYPYFHSENVEACARIVRIARDSGVRKFILLGSYFVHFDALWPELRLSERHPYIRSRVEQERAVFEGAGDTMQVTILQLPYIFGTIAGREPIWGFLVEMIRSARVVFFPPGGTAMMTVRQAAAAICGAVEREGASAAYALGGRNLSWREMIRCMLESLNAQKRIVTVPTLLAKLYGIGELARNRRAGVERGLHPVRYMDFQSRTSYIDPHRSQSELKYDDDDVPAAIAESVRATLR